MDSTLKNFLDQYFNFEIAGKKVTLPYWMNKLGKEIYGPHGGKGTPEEIRSDTLEAAEKENKDLEKMPLEEIYSFMKQNRIGLDCSGFAYQILNFLDLEKGGDGISNSVAGVNGMGITKTNADALTNGINSVQVENLKEVRPGDLIRMDGGRHVMVIVDTNSKEIIYAHISASTKKEGPHLAKINIINPDGGIEKQNWEELSKDNRNYRDFALRLNLGDGIRRLKIFL
ncbi:MAG: hypothetical protein Q8Q24_01500 [bacterium]|nr:hypothetical protein [bacterium]